VVVIIYDRGVHRRIRDVDVCNVGAADAIRRHIDFTRCQREPGDADSTASADSDAYAKVWPADPGDKRGGVNRSYIRDTDDGARRARHPAPDSANRNPAAVVKWRKAPRSIIYPGPAPGRNQHPVAVAIGRPADDSCVWKPNRAVPRTDNYKRSISSVDDVNIVMDRTKNRKSQIRGINFKRFVVLETAYPHVKGTFGDADLRHAVIEI